MRLSPETWFEIFEKECHKRDAFKEYFGGQPDMTDANAGSPLKETLELDPQPDGTDAIIDTPKPSQIQGPTFRELPLKAKVRHAGLLCA